eukprot:3002019-Pyramimonas_sp.AAC.2
MNTHEHTHTHTLRSVGQWAHWFRNTSEASLRVVRATCGATSHEGERSRFLTPKRAFYRWVQQTVDGRAMRGARAALRGWREAVCVDLACLSAVLWAHTRAMERRRTAACVEGWRARVQALRAEGDLRNGRVCPPTCYVGGEPCYVALALGNAAWCGVSFHRWIEAGFATRKRSELTCAGSGVQATAKAFFPRVLHQWAARCASGGHN